MHFSERLRLLEDLEETWALFPDMRFGQLLGNIICATGGDKGAFATTDESLSERNVSYRTLMRPLSAGGTFAPDSVALLHRLRALIPRYPDTPLGQIVGNLSAWSGRSHPWILANVEDRELLIGANSPRELCVSPDARRWPQYAIESPEAGTTQQRRPGDHRAIGIED